jgi:small-conductance mechanosensitive channel
MKQQNYSNHSKMVLGFHGILFVAIVALLIGAIRNLIKATDEDIYGASLLVLIPLIFLFFMYFTRAFALKAQDRAIKVEENFRHYLLTGKTLNSKLTMRQIIGLRFASDEEYIELAERAVKENLSEKDIKKSIKNWKADNYRV